VARYNFTTWAAKINASYEAKYGIRITPSIRNQSGQPYGRTNQRRGRQRVNYGTARILTEAISTHRQDTITIVDVRVEKAFKLAPGRNLSVFMDGYNLNEFERGDEHQLELGVDLPDAVHDRPTRLARFGAKFDW